MVVLIVDDIEINRKLLKVVLESEGLETLQASDGAEALKVLRRERVDAVISDILMPNMDGFRLCHEVRVDNNLRGIAFIIHTATYTSPSDQRLARDVGADAYLMKPAKTDQLINVVQEAKRKSEARSAQTTTTTTEDQLSIMKQYSVALVNKLEEKNTELERAVGELQRAHDRIMDLNKNLEQRVRERTAELERSLAQVRTLSGLLPICANCKKIRDDQGYWQAVEGFLMKHTGATFTHGICDDCGVKLYGDDYLKAKSKLARKAGQI